MHYTEIMYYAKNVIMKNEKVCDLNDNRYQKFR